PWAAGRRADAPGVGQPHRRPAGPVPGAGRPAPAPRGSRAHLTAADTAGRRVRMGPVDEVQDGERRAVEALEATGLRFRLVRHGPVSSLAEAAAARKVSPSQVVKTLVVRRGEDDYLFVLVPGDRAISWPKLRELLDVSRMSMPDA